MGRRLPVLFALLPAPVPAAPQTHEAALVEGTVVNRLTGAPVKHAHVFYIRVSDGSNEAGPSIGVDTDPGGHFSLPMAPGGYRLWVERAGFARQAYGARTSEGPGTLLRLRPGQQVHDLTLRMAPLGVISGHVFDEEGEPVMAASIHVLRFSYIGGIRQLTPVAGASSDDRGEYRVYGLPAGYYYLMAKLQGSPIARPAEKSALTPEGEEAYAPMYYPGVIDLRSARQIPLPQGVELDDIDFQAQRVRAVTLRGRLFSPLQDFTRGQVQVALAHRDGNRASYIDRAVATVDKLSGRFELRGVAPGIYWLVASQSVGGRALSGRAAVEVAGPNSQENLNISLHDAFEITGTVEIEGKPPNSLASMTVRLSASDGLALGPQPIGRVGADGGLRLPNLRSGLWELTLDPLPEGMWIKSAAFGGREATPGEIDIPDGPHGTLRIVLTGNGAEVSGAVTDDGQPHNATVVLVPDSETLRLAPRMYRSTPVREQGGFIFRSVPPGSYKLFAFEDVEPNAWLDPDFLKPVESLGEAVTVSAGERATRQLVPVPPDALLPQR